MDTVVAVRRLTQGSRLPDPASGQDLGPAAMRGPFFSCRSRKAGTTGLHSVNRPARTRKLEACGYKSARLCSGKHPCLPLTASVPDGCDHTVAGPKQEFWISFRTTLPADATLDMTRNDEPVPPNPAPCRTNPAATRGFFIDLDSQTAPRGRAGGATTAPGPLWRGRLAREKPQVTNCVNRPVVAETTVDCV